MNKKIDKILKENSSVMLGFSQAPFTVATSPYRKSNNGSNKTVFDSEIKIVSKAMIPETLPFRVTLKSRSLGNEFGWNRIIMLVEAERNSELGIG